MDVCAATTAVCNIQTLGSTRNFHQWAPVPPSSGILSLITRGIETMLPYLMLTADTLSFKFDILKPINSISLSPHYLCAYIS